MAENNLLKVFLDGTCEGSIWRQKIISMLNIDYFNPIYSFTDCPRLSDLENLNKDRDECDYCLYVITPSMQNSLDLVRAIDDSNKHPEKTILCVLNHEFPIDTYDFPHYKINFCIGEMKAFNDIGHIVENNGGKYFTSLEKVASYLNKQGDEMIHTLDSVTRNQIERKMIYTNCVGIVQFKGRYPLPKIEE